MRSNEFILKYEDISKKRMYLFYIDESGSPYSYSSRNEFFVLSAVLIDDECWNRLNSEVTRIKRKYFPNRDLSTVEIKGSNIWNAKEEFSGFDAAQIDGIFSDLFSVIDDNNVKIISMVIKKQQFLFANQDKDMLNECWKYMLERIEMFLTGEGGNQNGLIIMDSINPGEDIKRAKLLDSFKIFGTGRVNLEHVLEITFTDSGLKNLIQLADIVSYIVNLHNRQNTKQTSKKFWEIIEKRFRRDFNGNYLGVGYKVLP